MNRKVIAVVLCLALALSGGFDTVTQEAYAATTYCSACKDCGHSISEHAIDVDILNNSSLVDWCYTCKENSKTSPCKDKPWTPCKATPIGENGRCAEHGGVFKHEHKGWIYSSSDNVMNATCDCDCEKNGEELSLTLVIPDEPFYEGNAVNVTVGTQRELEAWTEAELEIPAIQYAKEDGETLDSEPSTIGNYRASITVGSETAQVEFTIEQAHGVDVTKYVADDDEHWNPCVRSDCTEDTHRYNVQSHDYTESHICVCGKKDPNYHEHVLGMPHEMVEATCSQAGQIEYWDCAGDCGKKLDKDANEISNVSIAIDNTNHVGDTEVRNSKEATWEEDGYTGDTYCKSCNKVLSQGEVISKLEPTPTPVPTATATVVPTPTATAAPTVAPTPTATAEATVVPTPTATAAATVAPTPTATAVATVAPTPAATEATVAPTPAATAVATVAPTPTATAEATVAPTPTATAAATVAPTPTATAAATVAPTPTTTAAATVAPTPTATAVATVAPTPTATAVATVAPTPTATAVATVTPTPDSDLIPTQLPVTPKVQTITTALIKIHKANQLKKKKISFSLKAKTSGDGKLSFKVTKGKEKYISVSKLGKVTLKKKCKKGTYKITITASATNLYKKATKVVTIKVK